VDTVYVFSLKEKSESIELGEFLGLQPVSLLIKYGTVRRFGSEKLSQLN